MDSRIGWGCRLSSDTHKKNNKKQHKTKNPAHAQKAIRQGEKTMSVIFQWSCLKKKIIKKKMKPSSRKTPGEACRGKMRGPLRGGAAGSHLPGRRRRVPAWSEPARGGKHRPGTRVHLGRRWNEFGSEPEHFKIEGRATTGVRGEGRKD